jgi:surfeit locus 1 family protein
MRRFPWILTIASALLFALLVFLGFWQVERLQWKQGLIAQAEAAATRPPAPVDEVLREGKAQFRRVVVDCPGLANAPYLELQSIHDGQPGVRLISACPTATGLTFLVDRGFVADGVSARPPVIMTATPVRIEAVVRRAPEPGLMALPPEGRRFFARDTPAMARALDVSDRVSPATLFAVTSSNPEWLALKPSAPPAAFSNNHLGYAITWFGLALVLAAFYIALLRRKLTPPPAAAPREGDDREERPF